MSHYQTILADLFQVFPTEVECPVPYDSEATLEEKFTSIKKSIEKAKRLGDRRSQLASAFFMGQFLEREVDSSSLRSHFAQQMSTHYRLASIRVFYIFEMPGVEQIMRTAYTTLTMVRKLDFREYQDLVAASIDFQRG